MRNIPILGLIENYAYFHCPDNGKDYEIFGPSHLAETADAYGLKVLARLPINPSLAAACDAGKLADCHVAELDDCCDFLAVSMLSRNPVYSSNIILITFSAGLYFSLPHSSGILADNFQ